MSGSWSKQRRQRQSAVMKRLLADPAFIAKRQDGWRGLTPEQRLAQAERMRAQRLDPEFRRRQRAGIIAGNQRRLTIPDRVHPIVRGVYVEINEQQASRAAIDSRSGVSKATLNGWRRRCMPRLETLEAVLNSLDLELAIVPKGTRDENGFARKKTKVQQEGVPA